MAIEPFRDVSSDPVHVVDVAALNDEEAGYVAAARAANTLRGYRSDWAEWCAWSGGHGYPAMPASAEGISRYLTFLAQAGAKVGTMSRRLSGIRFAHRMRDLPDPTATARVIAVWEGIRRTHAAPPEQAAPLMPPELFDVIDRCPTTKTWASPKRPSEADLAGLRDRALLLVGFVAALRRSELTALTVDQVAEHPNGLVISIARSKTNQTGGQAELAVLPRARMAARCPVTALQAWLAAAAITDGPVFRSVSTGNRAGTRALNPASVNALVQAGAARAGLDPAAYSAHSLRAGFVTYAHLRGASDRAIAHQTRHRSLATLGGYVRVAKAWDDNAATQLGL
jgi:site-specific recombinase XerD